MFKFIVTNTGNVTLGSLSLTDDVLDTVDSRAFHPTR